MSSLRLSTPPASRTVPWCQRSMRPASGSTARAPRSPAPLPRACGPKDIAAALGLSKSTVSYHMVRLGVEAPRGYQGRRAIYGTLTRSGIRASELCDLRVGEVRLHDPDGARFRIPDAKTEAGVREVQMSPELVEEFVSHFDRLRRAGCADTRRLRLSQLGRRADLASTRRAGRRRRRHARLRAGRPPGPAAAAPHHASHPAPYVHLDRAARQSLRRPLGHGPGRSRRFEDDPRRLRAVVAARQARARAGLRHPRPPGARAALRDHQRAPRRGVRADFRPRLGPRGHF